MSPGEEKQQGSKMRVWKVEALRGWFHIREAGEQDTGTPAGGHAGG